MINHKYYEINRIEEEGPFAFVLAIGPIDYFHYTLTKKQIIENILEDTGYRGGNQIQEISDIEDFVIDYTKRIEEEPFVRYISIPNQYSNEMELVAIARISNNGTGFIFSNDPAYLKYIQSIEY